MCIKSSCIKGENSQKLEKNFIKCQKGETTEYKYKRLVIHILKQLKYTLIILRKKY